MNLRRITRHLGAAALLLAAAAACAEAQGPSASGALEAVEIPADFTFATAQGLVVRAEGDPLRVAQIMAEVRLPDGELLHQGPLAAPVALSVPAAVSTLQVVLRTPEGERAVEVPVVGAEAVVEVE
jgi:hypothetical protein